MAENGAASAEIDGLEEPTSQQEEVKTAKVGIFVTYMCHKCERNVETVKDALTGFNAHQLTHMIQWDGGNRASNPPSLYTRRLLHILKRCEDEATALLALENVALKDKLKIMMDKSDTCSFVSRKRQRT